MDTTVLSPAVDASQVSSDAPLLASFPEAVPKALVFTKSSPHYEEQRSISNKGNNVQPMAVVQPLDQSALAQAVEYCSQRKISMSIRGGGHDLHGRCLIEGGVVIDVRRLDSLSLSDDKTVARVGGGVLAKKLIGFMHDNDVFVPTGSCDEVNYAGWAVGGGYGFTSGKYGLGVDQILGATIVTPSGSVIDTDDDPELLWAIRGAGNGGNFGVITELRIKVYPGVKILAGLLIYPLAQAQQVLGGFEDICRAGLPTETAGEMGIHFVENAGPVLIFVFHWVLDETNRERGLAYKEQLKSLGMVIMDTVTETTSPEYLVKSSAQFVTPQIWFPRAVSVSSLSKELIDILMANPPPKGSKSTYLIHHAHGKGLQPNKDAVFPNRERHFVIGISGRSLLEDTEEQKQETSAWADKIDMEIRTGGLAIDQGYMSFTQPEDCDAVRFFGQEPVERLRQLKVKYNPYNAFPLAYPVL